MKRFLISSIIFSILILTAGACTLAPTATSEPSETTSPIPTETPVPTETPSPTETPTPAEKRFNLDPTSFKVEVDELVDGIQINGGLITDKSLYPTGEVVRLSEKATAEFLLQCLFGGWKKSGLVPEDIKNDDVLYKYFTEQLALAQTENTNEQWAKVEFSTYADNTSSVVIVRPLYSGQIPDDIIAISNIFVALVNPSKVQNLVDMGLSYQQAQATNIYDNTIFIAEGMPVGRSEGNKDPDAVASMLSNATTILKRTSESPAKFENKSVMNKLISAGLTISK